MKRILLSLTMIALVLGLGACSSKSTATTADTGNRSLSLEEQLAVGTLKLEDTDQVVTAEQAADLLPLWQALQALYGSDTSATEEVDAVIDQIKDTMTSKQMSAIDGMQLSRQDIMSVMSGLGLSFNPGGANGTPDARFSGGFPAGGDDGGGFPAGGPGMGFEPGGAPGAGGGPGMGGGSPGSGFDPSMSATREAGGTGSGRIPDQVSPPLLNAVIELLQKKIQP